MTQTTHCDTLRVRAWMNALIAVERLGRVMREQNIIPQGEPKRSEAENGGARTAAPRDGG